MPIDVANTYVDNSRIKPQITNDELGDLTRDMIKLAETILAHEEAQKNWHKKLEQEVELRTAQLVEVNGQLESFTQ